MKAIDIITYMPKPTDKILVDANFLIFLHSPTPAGSRQAVYSSFYNNLLANSSELYLCSVVYSEFCNRIISNEERIFKVRWESLNPGNSYNKKHHWRSSSEFSYISSVLDAVFRTKMNNYRMVQDFFDTYTIDIANSLTGSDLNDELIVHCAVNNGLLLLTDDGDMSHYSTMVQILTANQRLISAT